MKKSRIIVDLEPRLKDWLEKYAETHYMSRNHVLAEAAELYRKTKEEELNSKK